MTIAGSSATVTLSGSGDVALIQQTSATAYDFDGNVTATIDGNGNAAAHSYDDFNNDVTDYQGQVVNGVGTYPISIVTPNHSSSYELYGYSTSGTLSGTSNVKGTDVSFEPGPNSAAPSLGAYWQDLGEVFVSSNTTSLMISYSGTSTLFCLVGQTASTIYDDDGNALSTTDSNNNTTSFTYNSLNEQTSEQQPSLANATQTTTDSMGNVTATIDPMGRVTATTYDAFGRAAETYQGQMYNTRGELPKPRAQ